jgi:hypothetical protein
MYLILENAIAMEVLPVTRCRLQPKPSLQTRCFIPLIENGFFSFTVSFRFFSFPLARNKF